MPATNLQPSSPPGGTDGAPVPKPRVWTAFAAIPTALVLGVALEIVVLIVLVLVLYDLTSDTKVAEANFALLMETPLGIVAAVAAIQVGFLSIALLGGYLSRTPLRSRLGLGGKRVGAVDCILAILGTLFVGQAAGLMIPLFWSETSEHLIAMEESLKGHGMVWTFGIAAAFSILPGFCEELLCRGYLQRRLLQRWNPVVAIGISSLAFGALHLDPQHMLVATALGVWLGFLAWRTDAIWLSILCHVANNATWIMVMNLTKESSLSASSNLPTDPLSITFFLVTGAAFLWSVRRLR